MIEAREFLDFAKFVVRELAKDFDAHFPVIFSFWLGIALTVVFFLPELLRWGY